jgi:hypothetical protein
MHDAYDFSERHGKTSGKEKLIYWVFPGRYIPLPGDRQRTAPRPQRR